MKRNKTTMVPGVFGNTLGSEHYYPRVFPLSEKIETCTMHSGILLTAHFDKKVPRVHGKEYEGDRELMGLRRNHRTKIPGEISSGPYTKILGHATRQYFELSRRTGRLTDGCDVMFSNTSCGRVTFASGLVESECVVAEAMPL